MLTEHSRGTTTRAPASEQIKQNWKSHCCELVSFQNSLGANERRKNRRRNGIELPLHPLQIIGWLTLILLSLATYNFIIPSFLPVVQLPFYVAISTLLLCHVISHIAALLIDPADDELRKVNSRKFVPEFDRTKHQHVIENGRCHLCNISTSSIKTKHCR